jgi:hypothetical protein
MLNLLTDLAKWRSDIRSMIQMQDHKTRRAEADRQARYIALADSIGEAQLHVANSYRIASGKQNA